MLMRHQLVSSILKNRVEIVIYNLVEKATMFEQTILGSLDMSKTMYFNDGSSFDFQSAQKQLAVKVGLSAFSSSQEIEAKIFNALNKEDEDSIKVMVGFYEWVQNIHNDKLVPPKEARFPNNMVYDILASLRSKSNLTPEQTLLRFFLEGANARKISKGNTPSVDFIATSLILDAVSAAEQLGTVSSAEQQFKKVYESLKLYVEPQKKLESAATILKNNPVYGFLLTKNILEFKKEKNQQTGANNYGTAEAIKNGLIILESYENKDNLALDIKEMVDSIRTILEEISPDFIKAQENSTESATNLAKWDASEWIAKFYTALSIAVKYDEKYQAVMDAFRLNSFFGEILLRNETGDYPANARNKAIEDLDITQLFTQAKFAEQVSLHTSSNYSIPKDSPITTNVSNNQMQQASEQQRTVENNSYSKSI